MCVCVFAIESHTVGVIEKQNVQWPLEFSVSGFYGNIFLIFSKKKFLIFSKNAFFKIKSRVIYQIKGLFITNFLMNFNLSIFKPISSYWRNKWNPWWMFLSRVLLHERDRERKICTEETLYSLSRFICWHALQYKLYSRRDNISGI